MGYWVLAAIVFTVLASSVSRQTAIAVALLIVLGALLVNVKSGHNFIGDITGDLTAQAPVSTSTSGGSNTAASPAPTSISNILGSGGITNT